MAKKTKRLTVKKLLKEKEHKGGGDVVEQKWTCSANTSSGGTISTTCDGEHLSGCMKVVVRAASMV